MARLFQVKDLLDEMKAFIEQVYFVDVCAIGAMYADWLKHGAGVTNYLSVPDLPLDTKGTAVRSARAARSSTATSRSVTPIASFDDPYFQKNVSESIAHSWYDGDWSRHPYEEDTVPEVHDVRGRRKYSWIKAPRFDGHVMQVGPLAQVLVGFAQGHEPTKRWAVKTLETAGKIAGADADAGRAALDARPPRGAHDPHGRASASWRSSTGSCSPRTSARATRASSTSRSSRRASSRASASTRRRAARCRTGSSSRTARSRTTRRSCRPRGTPARATRRTSPARTRRRSSATRSPTRSGRSKCCARSTRSTRASPARSTRSTSRGTRSRQRQGALTMDRTATYVLGLGNVLMGDDGFGPAVVRAFEEQYAVASDVTVVDLGTPGLDLSPWLADAEHVVLVDTVRRRSTAGIAPRLRQGRDPSPPAGGRVEPARSGRQGNAAHARVRRAGAARRDARRRRARAERHGARAQPRRCGPPCPPRSRRSSSALEAFGVDRWKRAVDPLASRSLVGRPGNRQIAAAGSPAHPCENIRKSPPIALAVCLASHQREQRCMWPVIVGRRIRIRGIVQGVGFRPWVYRQRAPSRRDRPRAQRRRRRHHRRLRRRRARSTQFVAALQRRPAAGRARSPSCRARRSRSSSSTTFAIVAERDDGATASVSIPPDLATCDRCAAEIADPPNRRYRYAFTNCTELRSALHDRDRRPVRPRDDDDGAVRDVPGVPARVRRRRRTGAFTRSRTPVPSAGRSSTLARAHGRAASRVDDRDCGRRRGAPRAGSSSPSRGSAASTWRATRPSPTRWRGCARASTATRSRSP